MRSASPSSSMASIPSMVFKSMTVSGYSGKISSFRVPRRSVPPAMTQAFPLAASFAA